MKNAKKKKENTSMEKLHYSITINAPKEKVWEIVFIEETYKQWTEPFSPGPASRFEGDWSEGSKILFLSTNEKTGKDEGMVSMIAENRLYEFLSIKHIGIMKDGVEDTESEEAKKWAPAFENYTFKETNGVTEFIVDVDIEEEYKSMFQDMWPKALQKLKELAEK
jgi:uncharacterized protein YndB with AHSA1/START domain